MLEERAVMRAAFQTFSDEVGPRAPLYRLLSRLLADEDEVLSLMLAAPIQQRRPVLLLAAIHDLLLEHTDLPLAQWYPSIASDPRGDDPRAALIETISVHRDRIEAIVSERHTQTNEVGRCAPLVIALGSQLANVPIGLVDVGCSAGLNLHLDAYGYRFFNEEYSWAEVLSPQRALTLECSLKGVPETPIKVPDIRSRVGVDAKPIDITNPSAVRWLEACVWPDQHDRLRRLRSAISIARSAPIPIVAADAVTGLEDALESIPEDQHPVLVNSWVLAYLSAQQRIDYRSIVDRVGVSRDLTWIYLEAPADCPELDGPRDPSVERLTAVMRIELKNGQRRSQHIGTMHPHGYWLHLSRSQT